MRRKSERVKSSPTVKRAENVTRRTTRRNKKSPEKSINEEESENSSGDQASSSENETEEVIVTKRGKRGAGRIEKVTATASTDDNKEKSTRSKRKTINKKDLDVEADEDDCNAVDTSTGDDGAETSDKIALEQPITIQQDVEQSEIQINLVQTDADNSRKNENQGNDTEIVDATPPTTKPVNDDEDNIEISLIVNESIIEMETDRTDECAKQKKQHEIESQDRTHNRQNREVIPEETDPVVDTVSTTTSDSSPKDKNDLNDLVTVNIVATNKTNKISEKQDIDASPPLAEQDSTDDTKLAESTHKGNNVQSSDEIAEPNDKKSANNKSNRILKTKETDTSNNSNTNIKQQPIVRKRKWLSNKSATPKIQEITISTDSLKGLISDVKPVPLSDVNLESSPEPDRESDDVKIVSSTSIDYNRRSEEHTFDETPPIEEPSKLNINLTRKVSIVHDSDEPRPPSPAKHNPCSILYITNLVRPFTVLQLKGLLLRTGKIVENGFWMDKIKSKCFVKYETEDEAVETRHALHGIRWPSSNPKCLNVDFGTEHLMEKAIASTAIDTKPLISSRDDRIGSSGDLYDYDKNKPTTVDKPVREWDVGKKADPHRTKDHDRLDKERDYNRSRDTNRDPEREKERERDRSERRRRSVEKRRKSPSNSPSRKFNKKENDPPIRLLDDLFRKTKTAPCIYWLPLTPEQIAIREEERLKQMAEHKRRIDAIKKERAEREQGKDPRAGDNNGDREKEKDRERDRDRDRDRRRRGNSRSSRDRDRGGRRRY